MTNKMWSEREVDYIRQGLSDLEIMQKTGRSALAVATKRRKLKEDTVGVEEISTVAPCMLMTQEEKEERIHNLADKYGVKLL